MKRRRARNLLRSLAMLALLALAACSAGSDVPRGGPQLPSYPFGSDTPTPSPSGFLPAFSWPMSFVGFRPDATLAPLSLPLSHS